MGEGWISSPRPTGERILVGRLVVLREKDGCSIGSGLVFLFRVLFCGLSFGFLLLAPWACRFGEMAQGGLVRCFVLLSGLEFSVGLSCLRLSLPSWVRHLGGTGLRRARQAAVVLHMLALGGGERFLSFLAFVMLRCSVCPVCFSCFVIPSVCSCGNRVADTQPQIIDYLAS